MSHQSRREVPAARRPARPSLRSQLLIVFGILALAGGAFYTALVVVTQIDHIFFPDREIKLGSSFSVLPGIDSEGTSGASLGSGEDGDDGRRINVLVMGLDKRPRDGDLPTRTDTMFVVTIDPATDTARGLAMPRDLWVEIPYNDEGGFIEERINTAYQLGETEGWNGGGIETVEATVERLTGIEVDHYVIIDFDGFREVINILGGINVTVPVPGVNDPYYSETELPGDYYPCVFEPGEYHMDGSQALCFARVRRGSNDLERILRQQLVILSVMDKAAELDFLGSPQALVNLWQNYKNTVKTDVSDLQAPGYARLAASINPNSLAFLTLGVVATPWTTPEGAQVLVPSAEGVAQLVDAFLSDNRLVQENPVVEVQNATGTVDHLEAAVDFLVGHGLTKDNVSGVDAATAVGVTEIVVFNSDKDYSAARIAEWLDVPTAQVRQSTELDAGLRTGGADIVVVLGSDTALETLRSR